MKNIRDLLHGVDYIEESYLLDWHKSARYMTLAEMCEAMEVDYEELREIARKDVVSEFRSEMMLDIELDRHLRRIRQEATKDGRILLAYQR